MEGQSTGISFFSESDMVVTKDGQKRIASEMPIWYSRQMIDELSEDIRMAEFEIKSGRVKDTKLGEARERLNKLQKKMDEVSESMPKLDSATKDMLAKARKDLGKEIAAKMFTRSDMKKGLADAHEEVRRSEMPSIKLSPAMQEIARASNVTPVNGMVSRDQASKMWKLTSRILDENSNTEVLRRD